MLCGQFSKIKVFWHLRLNKFLPSGPLITTFVACSHTDVLAVILAAAEVAGVSCFEQQYSCCRGNQGSVCGTATCSPSWMAWFYTVHWQASVGKCGPWTGALRKVTFSTAPASCPLSKGLISPNFPLCECLLKSEDQGNWGGSVEESYSLTEQQASLETLMFPYNAPKCNAFPSDVFSKVMSFLLSSQYDQIHCFMVIVLDRFLLG